MSSECFLSRVEIFRAAIMDEDRFEFGWEWDPGLTATRTGTIYTRQYDDWLRTESGQHRHFFKEHASINSNVYNKIGIRVKRSTGTWGISIWDSGIEYVIIDGQTGSGFFEFDIPSGRNFASTDFLVNGICQWDYMVIYKNSALIVEVSEADITLETQVAAPTITLDLTWTRDVSLPVAGDKIKVFMSNPGEEIQKVFTGRVSFVKQKEEGKTNEISVDAVADSRILIDSKCVVGKSRRSWNDIFTSCMQSLISSSKMTLSCHGTFTSITVQQIKSQEIFSSMRTIAEENNIILSPDVSGQCLYAFTPTSMSYIDTISPYSYKCWALEYAEDDRRVKNIVNIDYYGGIEKDGSTDAYSDEIAGWYACKKIASVWTTISYSLYDSQKVEGNYSILVQNATWAMGDWEDIWICKDLGKSVPTSESGQLKFFLSEYTERNIFAVLGFLGNERVMLKLYLLPSFSSRPPEYTLTNYALRELDLRGGFADQSAVFQGYNITLGAKPTNWSVVGGFDFNIGAIGWKFTCSHLYSTPTYFNAAIDRLHISELGLHTSYVVQSSVDQYGPRELLPPTISTELKTQAEIEEKARSLIDPICYSEKSLRSLSLRRFLDTLPGRQLAVPITSYSGVYNAQKIHYNLEHTFLTTTISLSKSPLDEPTRTQETDEETYRKKIKKLEYDLNLLTQKVDSINQVESKQSDPGSSNTITFQNKGIDWASLGTGIGALAGAVITQMFTSMATLITNLGNIAWDWITKTATNILTTIGNWANMVSQFGNLAWSWITKTTSDILNVIGSWWNMVSSFGNFAWSYISKTAGDVITTIGSWNNMITQLGAISTGFLTGILNSAQLALSSFISGFFDLITGRQKFASGFVDTTLIQDLAVTARKWKPDQIAGDTGAYHYDFSGTPWYTVPDVSLQFLPNAAGFIFVFYNAAFEPMSANGTIRFRARCIQGLNTYYSNMVYHTEGYDQGKYTMQTGFWIFDNLVAGQTATINVQFSMKYDGETGESESVTLAGFSGGT